jgi:vanillate O-demethylase ferredoxin subunit
MKTMPPPASLPARVMDVRLAAVRWEAAGIHSFEFRAVGDAPLPAFTAGAHVDVHLPGGTIRQYSLCNAQDERDRYVVAVKRDANSRGGSSWLHEQARVGAILRVSEPRNHFMLHEEAPHSVLIAGGIGITPIACMTRRLRALGRSWELHYSVRRRDEAAFLSLLGDERMHLHVDEEHAGAPLPLDSIVAAAPADAHLYCCGPGPMLDAFEAASASRPPSRVHLERFAPAQAAATEGGFVVKLARSGGAVRVAPGCTILDALREHGMDVQASCEQGICGTCETRVLAGRPDHRDSLLSDDEKAANNVMMVCCSGSRDDVLVLDL